MNIELINEYSRDFWEDKIMQWIHNERDRDLLRRRLLDGVCFEALAEEFDMSTVQTKNRVYKAQKQLFNHV